MERIYKHGIPLSSRIDGIYVCVPETIVEAFCLLYSSIPVVRFLFGITWYQPAQDLLASASSSLNHLDHHLYPCQKQQIQYKF